MKLYSYWRSSSAWRVRTALAFKGLSYEYRAVNLIQNGGEQNTDEYRALNPSGTVPLLEFDEGGQTQRLSQSVAIIEFLEERFPNPPLLPNNPFLRARTRMLVEMVNSGIQPLQTTAVVLRIKNGLRADERAWAKHWNERGLAALERWVSGETQDFCVGGGLSMADVYLIPQLYSARRFGVDLSPFKKLLRIEAHCESLPAFKHAHPDQQPDAVPPEA
jgi:maleylpyruvate isomerase